MTATTVERHITKAGTIPQPSIFTFDVAAATKILKGWIVAIDIAGNAVAGAATTGLRVMGVARADADNTSGAAGALTVDAEPGTFRFVNGDSITKADVGCLAYLMDNQTVAKGSGTGATAGRPIAGKIVQVDAAGVRVYVGPDAHPGIIERVLRIQHSDLEVAALTGAINLGAILPARARLIGREVQLATLFSGGAVSACTVQIGDAGDPDSIMTATDIFTGASGFPKAGTGGVLGGAGHAADFGGVQLQALFTVVGANLTALTAGDLTIRLYFLPL